VDGHGGTILVVGDAWERDLADAVASHLGAACFNLAGKTSLPVLGAVLARLAVLVTNDSGPAHIAYALGTPSVTIFGGADPETYGPPTSGRHRVVLHDVPCRPSGPTTCPSCPYDHACLAAVAVTQVLAAAEDAMRSAAGGGALAPAKAPAVRRSAAVPASSCRPRTIPPARSA
jgi:ADP-heptose:LPS heptosyltransferase